MKKLNYLATAALAAGGLLAGSLSAHAVQYVTTPGGAAPGSGDLIFTAFVNDGANTSGDTGGTQDLEVDLGSLVSLGSGATINLSADLDAIFGNPSNAGADAWNSTSRPDTLSWVVYGANTSTDEFLVTDSGTGLTERGTTQQVNVVNEISPIYSDLDVETPTGNNGNSDANVSATSSDPKSFSQQYTTDFNYNGSHEWDGGSPIQNVNLTLGDPVAFYDAKTASGTTTLAPEAGTFTLESDGDLVYTSASVPEPSTWASMIFGAASLLALRRRRRA